MEVCFFSLQPYRKTFYEGPNCSFTAVFFKQSLSFPFSCDRMFSSKNSGRPDIPKSTNKSCATSLQVPRGGAARLRCRGRCPCTRQFHEDVRHKTQYVHNNKRKEQIYLDIRGAFLMHPCSTSLRTYEQLRLPIILRLSL